MPSQAPPSSHVVARIFQVLLYVLAVFGALFTLGWSCLGVLVWLSGGSARLGLGVIGLALGYTLSFTGMTGGLAALIGLALRVDERLALASPPAWSPGPGLSQPPAVGAYAATSPGW